MWNEDTLSPLGIELDNQLLLFGDSPQKVISLLGRPQSLSVKTSNSNIYRRVNVEEEEYEFDYFFTYFSIGIDILFSVETHKIIKFILHTNFPNSPQFNLYNKCQYKYLFFCLSRFSFLEYVVTLKAAMCLAMAKNSMWLLIWR